MFTADFVCEILGSITLGNIGKHTVKCMPTDTLGIGMVWRMMFESLMITVSCSLWIQIQMKHASPKKVGGLRKGSAARDSKQQTLESTANPTSQINTLLELRGLLHPSPLLTDVPVL